MRAVPLLVSCATALAAVPATVFALRAHGPRRTNFRGAPVAFPAGVAVVASGGLALGVLAAAAPESYGSAVSGDARLALVYVPGVALLGLADDLLGERAAPGAAPPPRGWRGHLGAAAAGRPSTGLLKAVGALVLAVVVLAGRDLDAAARALAVLLLVLTTNLFNLLDLRPGRSIKVLLALGGGLALATHDLDPLLALGLFLGPLLVLLPFDLRELAMLGDTGSNAAGAVAGLWLVLGLSTTAQAVALALVAAATAYGELRSISALVARTPWLRHLDSLGRISHA